MNEDLHAALIAKMLAKQSAFQAEKEAESFKSERVAKPAKEPKGKKPKSTDPKNVDPNMGASAPSTAPKVKGFSIPGMPGKGTIDAKEYRLRMRRTFVTNENGVQVSRDPTREEQMFAIGAFVGYDGSPESTFSANLLRADFAAKRETYGVVIGASKEETRAIQDARPGYVTGIPDNRGKLLSSLRAREKASVDEMIVAEREGDVLAHAEAKARLITIREDLDRLG